MKQKINKYYSFFLLTILMFFTVNSIKGNIAFGYGLGDIVYILTLWGITLAFIIAIVINRNSAKKLLVSNVVFTIPILWIALSATFWRGVEYRWNGEIFYPSKKSIEWHAKNERRWNSEIDSLKVIVKVNPQNTKALVKIGELKGLLGEWEESLRYLEEALIKGDTSKYTRFKLARRYEDSGMKNKAIEQYEEILKIDSQNKSAVLKLRSLKNEK